MKICKNISPPDSLTCKLLRGTAPGLADVIKLMKFCISSNLVHGRWSNRENINQPRIQRIFNKKVLNVPVGYKEVPFKYLSSPQKYV